MIYIPSTWSLIVQFFEKFVPRINYKNVIWIRPKIGVYKCTSDGSSKSTIGDSSGAFYIRDWEGTLVFAEIRRLKDGPSIVAEVNIVRAGILLEQ